jgi:hypothetical protein
MKRKIRMLKDYYYEGGKHEVWWAGDVLEIDEVAKQVSVDYLVDAGYCEDVEGAE